MNNKGYFDKYPLSAVLISNLVSLAIYASGAYILYQVNIIVFVLYLVLLIWLEFRLLKNSCKDCWYYGKICAFGKGKLACCITGKGDTEKFAQRKPDWKSLLPDILVMAVPVISAIVLMIINFRWILLVLMLLILILSSAGNGFVRGRLACKYCRQREFGCPAATLFNDALKEK